MLFHQYQINRLDERLDRIEVIFDVAKPFFSAFSKRMTNAFFVGNGQRANHLWEVLTKLALKFHRQLRENNDEDIDLMPPDKVGLILDVQMMVTSTYSMKRPNETSSPH